MRDCETLREDLKAYMDGELPLGGRLALRLHLARCAECREEITAMENISRELRASEAAGLSSELRERLVGAIPTDLPKADAKDVLKTNRKPSRPLILWGATATAAMLWFVCYPLVNNTRSQRQETATVGASPMMEQSAGKADKYASLPAEMSNMKQLGTGTLMYSQDYDGAPTVASEGIGGGGGIGGSFGSGRGSGGRGIETDPVGSMNEMSLSSQERKKFQSSPGAPASTLPATKMAQTETENGKRRSVMVAQRNPEAKPARMYANEVNGLVAGGIERQVHREGDITVVVDNPEAKMASVEDMVKIEGGGGYVATSQMDTLDDGGKYATLTVKIPVNQFDAFLNKVARLGNVKAKNVSGEDLTEKISDSKQEKRVLTAEIKETQKRLDRSRNRTQNRLDAEDLRQLRIRNAQTQARLDMLTKMATLATLTITLEEKPKKVVLPPAPQTGGFLHELRETAQTAGQTFTQAAKLPFILLVWIIVYAPVWLLLLVGYRRFVRG